MNFVESRLAIALFAFVAASVAAGAPPSAASTPAAAAEGAAPSRGAEPTTAGNAPKVAGKAAKSNAVTLTPGQDAPPLALRDSNGKMTMLSSFKKGPRNATGQIVLVDFFATWCQPCQRELPIVVEFARKYKDQGVELMLVGFQEDGEKLEAFVKEKQLEFLTLSDRYGVAGKAFGVDSLPRLVVVSREGKIVEVLRGEHPDIAEKLEAAVKKAL